MILRITYTYKPDALGLSRQTTDGLHDLTWSYDGDGRPVQVQNTVGGRVWKTWTYGTTGSAKGRLIEAMRSNDPPVGEDVAIIETYLHNGGTAGPSQILRQVRWPERAGDAQWVATFRTTLGYNKLGQPISMGYPTCVANTGSQGSATPCNDGNDTPAPVASGTWTYNEGLMRKASLSLGPQAVYSYAHNLQLGSVAFGNGVVGTYTQGTNGMVRPARREFKKDGVTLFDTGVYAYDAAGNIKSIGDDNYTYDGAHRIRSGTVKAAGPNRFETYEYDTADNVTKVTSDVFGMRPMNVDPATNRLLGVGVGAVDWTYDAAGSVTSAVSNTFHFEWDAFNMQTRHTDYVGDFVSVYGPGDYRVWVEKQGTGVKNWTSRGPDGKILREFELSANGNSWKHIRDYLYGAEGIVATVKHDGTQRYFHSDHLGSPRLFTTILGGPLSYHHYYPFGAEAEPAGYIFDDDFEGGDLTAWNEGVDELAVKYTGHQRELHKNSDYMLGRHYIYAVNRFASVDPAWDGWNLYTYVGNNPLARVDPTGEATSLVFHGKGYLANDMEGGSNDVGQLFAAAASTRASEIEASEDFDPENDAVIVIEVGTAQELADALNNTYDSGPIESIDIFSHGYPGGLNLGEGPALTRAKNFEVGDVGLLEPDLAPGASCTLYGCNTGRGNPSIAQAMADALGIPVTGATGYTWFTNTNPTASNPKVHQVPQSGTMMTFEPRP